MIWPDLGPPMRLVLAAFLALWGASLGASPPQYPSREPGVLVIGRISEDPRTLHQTLKPLLDYVVARMADLGIRRGEVLLAPSDAVMRSYLRTGLIDWVSETPAQALQIESAGARPILVTERKGRSKYRTVFFARKETGIGSLADLRGRRLALQHEFSTSAYVIPLGLMLEQGLELTLLPSPRLPVPDTKVGIVLARSEHNIAFWVHRGLAEAGAFSDLDFNDPERVPALMREDLAIFHEGPLMPRGLELVRGDLPPELTARLREVLLAAPSDPEAAPALLAFGGATRFHPVDEETLRELHRVRELLARSRGLER